MEVQAQHDADKLDDLLGCFAARLIPTGSQDPYALRRKAAGAVGDRVDPVLADRDPVEHDVVALEAVPVEAGVRGHPAGVCAAAT